MTIGNGVAVSSAFGFNSGAGRLDLGSGGRRRVTRAPSITQIHQAFRGGLERFKGLKHAAVTPGWPWITDLEEQGGNLQNATVRHDLRGADSAEEVAAREMHVAACVSIRLGNPGVGLRQSVAEMDVRK